jgi:small subunit ribosomal protein S17
MERNLRKERIGIVTSNKMEKSVVVMVETKVMHPKIMETRPMSKLKRWRLVEIVEKAK